LRMLLGPAPEQISGRAVAESLAVAGHQVADRAPGPSPAGPYLMVASGGGAGLVRISAGFMASTLVLLGSESRTGTPIPPSHQERCRMGAVGNA
jgi:hypothetical protein